MLNIRPASEWKPNEIGAYSGLSMDTYLSAPGVSRSKLRVVAERPSHHDRDSKGESDALTWGTLFNDALLFGTRNYYVRPETYKDDKGEVKSWNGNSTVCKKWLAEHSDKPVLNATGKHSADWIEKAVRVSLADPKVVALLQGATPEVSIFARHEEYPLLLKGRPDIVNLSMAEGVVVFADIKTTVNAGTRAFARDMLKFGYYRQAALGRMITERLGASPFQFYLIIVEKGDDPRVQVRRLAIRAMDKGDLDNDDDLKLYLKCKLENVWPDFPDQGEPHIWQEIDLPDYLYGDVDELSGMTEIEEDKQDE